MSIVIKWTLGILLALVLLKALVWWLQPRLAFYPRRGPTPAPGTFAAFEVTTADGETLHGWQLPADTNAPVVIYFCGNAGNLEDRSFLLSGFAGKGIGVVAFNYRGMGESSGSPSEDGVYSDAEAVYRHVTESQGIDPRRVVLWGHSIGGAVASWLATQKPCAGLILESTFRSAKVMAGRILPILPISPFLTYRFDNEQHMADLRVPVLLIHGLSDTIIPSGDSELLFTLAHDPKELWLIPQGGHNDLAETAGHTFYIRITDFARRVTRH